MKCGEISACAALMAEALYAQIKMSSNPTSCHEGGGSLVRNEMPSPAIIVWLSKSAK
jgi:hypothetical protein